MFFISGDSDQLVPPSHMRQLYEKATSSVFKDFYSVSGGTHNDTYMVAGAQYYKRLKAFLFREEITKGECLAKDGDSSAVEAEASAFGNVAIPTMQKDFSVRS